jgi:hypothetical protein
MIVCGVELASVIQRRIALGRMAESAAFPFFGGILRLGVRRRQTDPQYSSGQDRRGNPTPDDIQHDWSPSN